MLCLLHHLAGPPATSRDQDITTVVQGKMTTASRRPGIAGPVHLITHAPKFAAGRDGFLRMMVEPKLPE